MASYRAQVTVTAATAANITFTKPTGTADGDILIATIHVEDDVAVTPPVGWSLLLNVDNASSAFDHWVFWKRAGSAEGASYLFTHASTWRTGYIEAIQSASADWNPVASGAQGSSTTPLATAVSALASSAYLTFLIGVFGDMGSFLSPPGAMTERWDINGNMYVASETLASSGSTGTRGVTLTGGSEPWVALLTLVEDAAYTKTHPNISHSTSEIGTSLGAANAMPLPDNAASGDLVIYWCANDNTGATNMSASTGWTTGTLQGTTALETQIFARVLDGATGDNILAVTGAAQDYACIGVRVPSGDHGVTSGNIASWMSTNVATATATSATADPPNLSPGSSNDYLWLTAIALDTSTNDQIATDPTGYSNVGYVKSAASTSSCALRVSMKQATASSDNPASVAVTSLLWHAYTVAVPPAGGGGATHPHGARPLRSHRPLVPHLAHRNR
jgi:hypothetical protein